MAKQAPLPVSSGPQSTKPLWEAEVSSGLNEDVNGWGVSMRGVADAELPPHTAFAQQDRMGRLILCAID